MSEDVSSEFITISKDGLSIRLCAPASHCEKPYYQGTRFDGTGVFRSIEVEGRSYADEWFDHSDPFRHDRVCGPSEEFDPVWLPDGKCLKIGVGILDADRKDYDRFKLYTLLERGFWKMDVLDDKVIFYHEISGQYRYTKTVAATSGNSFEIRHSLEMFPPQEIHTLCYNHNFFTLGRSTVDEKRCLEFADSVSGTWREDSLHARAEGMKILFDAPVQPGQKAFMADTGAARYDIKISDSRSIGVHITCPLAIEHCVFWNNDRVACPEPYVKVDAEYGAPALWTINYELWKQ